MAQQKNAAEEPTGRCFMITPIGSNGSPVRKHADWVYKYVGDACKARRLTLERADSMAGSPMITSRIFEAVQSADICVADLTCLNANVFYELGVRHSLAKPVIHIAADGTDLPFDNAQHDTIFFDLSSIEAMEGLTKAVGRQIDEISKSGYVVSNPFTAALGAIQLAKSGDPRDQVIARLEERLSALERGPAQSAPSNPRLAVLRDLLARSRAPAKGTRFEVSPDFFKDLIEEIPPWDSTQAQELIWELHRASNLDNRSELVSVVTDRFPDVIPF